MQQGVWQGDGAPQPLTGGGGGRGGEDGEAASDGAIYLDYVKERQRELDACGGPACAGPKLISPAAVASSAVEAAAAAAHAQPSTRRGQAAGEGQEAGEGAGEAVGGATATAGEGEGEGEVRGREAEEWRVKRVETGQAGVTPCLVSSQLISHLGRNQCGSLIASGAISQNVAASSRLQSARSDD